MFDFKIPNEDLTDYGLPVSASAYMSTGSPIQTRLYKNQDHYFVSGVSNVADNKVTITYVSIFFVKIILLHMINEIHNTLLL